MPEIQWPEKSNAGRNPDPSQKPGRIGHPPLKSTSKSQLNICTAPSTPTVLSSLKTEPMIQTENTEREKEWATRHDFSRAVKAAQ